MLQNWSTSLMSPSSNHSPANDTSSCPDWPNASNDQDTSPSKLKGTHPTLSATNYLISSMHTAPKIISVYFYLKISSKVRSQIHWTSELLQRVLVLLPTRNCSFWFGGGKNSWFLAFKCIFSLNTALTLFYVAGKERSLWHWHLYQIFIQASSWWQIH